MLGYSRPPAKPASQRTRAITATKVVPWVPVKSVDLGPSFTGGYTQGPTPRQDLRASSPQPAPHLATAPAAADTTHRRRRTATTPSSPQALSTLPVLPCAPPSTALGARVPGPSRPRLRCSTPACTRSTLTRARLYKGLRRMTPRYPAKHTTSCHRRAPSPACKPLFTLSTLRTPAQPNTKSACAHPRFAASPAVPVWTSPRPEIPKLATGSLPPRLVQLAH